MRPITKRKLNAVADTLHKGFVLTCIGVTLYATSILSYKFYKYMTETRPKYLEQRRLMEQSLLAEGSSENLKDIAPNIPSS